MGQSALSLVILLGPPGAGKSTQAALLGKSLKIPVISCGDIFRQHVEAETDFGNLAKSYIAKGELTPDAVTAAMMLNHVKRLGESFAVVEGFPRTIGQVEAMSSRSWSAACTVASAVRLDTGDDVLLERVAARRICPQCWKSYSIRDDLQLTTCSADGAILVQRQDDRSDVVRSRIALYRMEEMPVVEHYRVAGNLMELDAAQGAEALHLILRKHLEALSG